MRYRDSGHFDPFVFDQALAYALENWMMDHDPDDEGDSIEETILNESDIDGLRWRGHLGWNPHKDILVSDGPYGIEVWLNVFDKASSRKRKRDYWMEDEMEDEND